MFQIVFFSARENEELFFTDYSKHISNQIHFHFIIKKKNVINFVLDTRVDVLDFSCANCIHVHTFGCLKSNCYQMYAQFFHVSLSNFLSFP